VTISYNSLRQNQTKRNCHATINYRCFLLWSRKGILIRLFKRLSQDNDTEWEFIDGSYVKAHQHCAGAASKHEQAISLSRGGNTSKIDLAVDSYDLAIEFIITGGDVHDRKVANELIELLPQGDFVIANKGYNSEAIRNKVREKFKPCHPEKVKLKNG
jgi:hypothetical protein